jgi:DNA-binding CsgD family transcriptional regulator
VIEQRSVVEVASELWITQQTVEFHLRNIIRKLLEG